MTENRKTWNKWHYTLAFKLLNIESEGKTKFGFYVMYFYELIILFFFFLMTILYYSVKN